MKGLRPGTAYVFRVRAQNLAGVGRSSAALGPVLAQTRPGKTHPVFVRVLDFVERSLIRVVNLAVLLRNQGDLCGRGRRRRDLHGV